VRHGVGSRGHAGHRRPGLADAVLAIAVEDAAILLVALPPLPLSCLSARE
jgi:hypothetical protein